MLRAFKTFSTIPILIPGNLDLYRAWSMLGSTMNDNERFVSAIGHPPLVSQCYLVLSAGYNFQEGGACSAAGTIFSLSLLDGSLDHPALNLIF